MLHKSVLLTESIENLNIKDGGIYVDATMGYGGHSKEILKKNKTGFLYGFDQDEYAVDYSNKFLKEFKLSMDIASMIDVNATLSINEDNMGNAVFDNNLINDYCNNYAYGDGRYYSHSNSKN